MRTERIFGAEAHEQLRKAYPEAPCLIPHGMENHPLLELDALADLALSMRPVDVEYNRADLPVGIAPEDIPLNGLDIVETIRSIETNGSWMVLKFIEQSPVYRDFLHETLAEIAHVVGPVTGSMHKLEGFIFLSSPDAVTPFHMDPEHNILIQLRGEKTITVFPPDDEVIVPPDAHERFHAGGHRNLAWRDEFGSLGQAFHLTPGKAIYVPVKAPHWVRNGSTTSISLSVTWQSEWSYRERYARSMNAMLRQYGLNPASPGRFPVQNHAKSLAWRAISKVRRIAGAGDAAD